MSSSTVSYDSKHDFYKVKTIYTFVLNNLGVFWRSLAPAIIIFKLDCRIFWDKQ